MKKPNTHSQDWKVVIYHAGEIIDTKYFDTAEEASRFSHDLNELLETSLHVRVPTNKPVICDGVKMFCDWMPHSSQPAQILLDWL